MVVVALRPHAKDKLQIMAGQEILNQLPHSFLIIHHKYLSFFHGLFLSGFFHCLIFFLPPRRLFLFPSQFSKFYRRIPVDSHTFHDCFWPLLIFSSRAEAIFNYLRNDSGKIIPKSSCFFFSFVLYYKKLLRLHIFGDVSKWP